MGFFDNLFGSASAAKDDKALPWIPLQHIHQLDTIKEASKTHLQIIFKHSTRCGISRMVINQFATHYTLTENQADLYYLDLLNFRDLSNEVGYVFQVIHQSPQVLVIKNGVVVAHASHSDINHLDFNGLL